jgi:hypothetical protein
MWIRHALLLLGVLLLAPTTPVAHAQDDARPRRAMLPFGSDAELLQYLAAVDRARPSRRPQAHDACADSAGPAPGDKRVVITGRVRDPAGSGVASARVYALDRCTTAGADGGYRLELPARVLKGRSRVRVSADFIGYRRASRTVAVRRRMVSADFTLVPSPVELQELTVADAASPLAARDESITNTQHAGVDEGGIVKLHGDHLIVLRRGRLFTVSVRAGELRPVAMVDAYPPGAEPAEWYDEMLVEGDRVIVIGYSYRRGGTEVSLFAIDGQGGLRHLSTSHLKSNDYYSSRNYAARLVDGKLVFYTPLWLGFQEPLASLPAMREWRPGGDSAGGGAGGFERIATPRRIYRPARSLEGSEQLTLHTITQCAIGGSKLECDASVVVGPFSRVFYVSPKAVYVWAADWPYRRDGEAAPESSMLFRLPLDGGSPSALSVEGAPVDQFSFLESEDGHINVMVQPEGTGDWMWTAEWRQPGADSLRLLRAPLSRFDDGEARAEEEWYRALPPPARGAFHNRFVGDHLLYGSGNGWWNNAVDTGGTIFVVHRRGGEVTRLGLPHSVDRIEVMGPDAVVVGGSGGDLHFSGVRLGARPVVAQRFVLDSASQGETRSHGFFYRTEGARTGILGLPVRGPGRPGWEHLVEGSASVVFLANQGRRFTRLGALASSTEAPVADGCKASCVDWYGNARPIFLRGRILALLGYELVEGAADGGEVREVRRASFAPVRVRTTLRD